MNKREEKNYFVHELRFPMSGQIFQLWEIGQRLSRVQLIHLLG